MKMSSFNVYQCDWCGSKSAPTQNNFKPDEWFYGRIDNFHITLPFVTGFNGEAGHFCSVNCAKLFVGSVLLNWKHQIDAQCNENINKKPADFSSKGELIVTAEDEPEDNLVVNWE
jgi:hypothetical protein